MVTETWKPVVGFENYKVSNLGRVMNSRGYICRLGADSSGYLTVELNRTEVTISGQRRNRPKERFVHRLVAEAFIPNPEGKEQVNHKDGDHLNACVDNLEWVTQEENLRHAKETGLALKSRCEFEGDYDAYLEEYNNSKQDWQEYNEILVAKLREIDQRRIAYNESRKNTLDELKKEKQRLSAIAREKKIEATKLRNSPEWQEEQLSGYIKKCEEEFARYKDNNKELLVECEYQDTVIEFLECKKALAASKINELYAHRPLKCKGYEGYAAPADIKKDRRENDLYDLKRKLESSKTSEETYKRKCKELEKEIKVLRKTAELGNQDVIVKTPHYMPILKRGITVYTQGKSYHYPTVPLAAQAHGYKCGQDLLNDLINKEATIFGTYARYDKIS